MGSQSGVATPPSASRGRHWPGVSGVRGRCQRAWDSPERALGLGTSVLSGQAMLCPGRPETWDAAQRQGHQVPWRWQVGAVDAPPGPAPRPVQAGQLRGCAVAGRPAARGQVCPQCAKPASRSAPACKHSPRFGAGSQVALVPADLVGFGDYGPQTGLVSRCGQRSPQPFLVGSLLGAGAAWQD